MYGVNFSGGSNKSCGQIEQEYRVDSFGGGKMEGLGTLHARRGNSTVDLRCIHSAAEGRETVELPGFATLELTRIPSGFGGSRAFWVCPRCGKRARYLYATGKGYVCRTCAKLNYQCQKRTQDSITYAQAGLRFAREKLRWKPPGWVTYLDFPDLCPPRPRYMHEATYQRHLARFRRYQERYKQEMLREMSAILGRTVDIW